MRFDNRIVNFGDTHCDCTFERRPADGDLRAGRRQSPPRDLPAVQDALRRARPLAAADTGGGGPRSRRGVQRRAPPRPARSHHAAHRAPRSSGRGRRVPAPSCAIPSRGASHARPCTALGSGRRGRGPRGRRVPRVRDGSQQPCPADRPGSSAARQCVDCAAGRRQTISSSSRSTRRSSDRARARCAPTSTRSIMMTTPLEIREVSYVRE